MKNLLLLSCAFSSFSVFSQNINGLYSGTLQNDSAKMTQQYELALSEYRGKITGYAYATFFANDTFYYSIRRVKAAREAGQLVVEDVEMIANNFPVRPDKGVHRVSYIPLNDLKEGDTLAHFAGSWKTTGTKKFYSIPGTMAMKRERDSAHSALVAHLRELNIIAPENSIASRHEKPKPETIRKETHPKQERTAAPVAETNAAHGVLKKLDQPVAKTAASAATSPKLYTERKTAVTQTLDVVSDSLVLRFYDNGVVDGDVISVYVSGEAIVSNAKLLEAATRKTVQLPAGVDSVELLLVAETLGSIPPNTGLLVVQDGSARYDVRFSADLQTNASIIFRKKK